jgi:hypothetical protein
MIWKATIGQVTIRKATIWKMNNMDQNEAKSEHHGGAIVAKQFAIWGLKWLCPYKTTPTIYNKNMGME